MLSYLRRLCLLDEVKILDRNTIDVSPISHGNAFLYILTRLTRRVPHAEHELLIISENLSIPPVPYLSWKELHVYLNMSNTTHVIYGAGLSYPSGGKYLRACTKFVSFYIPLKI